MCMNTRNLILCISMLAVSFPAVAQHRSAVKAAGSLMRGELSSASLIKSANISGGLTVPGNVRLPQPVSVSRMSAVSAQTPLSMPKMMATPTYKGTSRDEHYKVYMPGTTKPSGLGGAMTAYREYTGPGLTKPQSKPVASAPAVPEKYFRQRKRQSRIWPISTVGAKKG